VRLSQAGSVLDGATSQRVGAEIAAALGTDGSMPSGLALVPNDAITPSGTYYLVEFTAREQGSSTKRWTEKWRVPSGAALDVGAVPRLDVVPGAVYQPLAADVTATTVTAPKVDGTTGSQALSGRFSDLAAHVSGWVNVRSYGAACDGVTDDTANIQSALDAARDAGGGRVFVPASTVIGAALVIASNTWLEVASGATVTFRAGSSGNMLRNAAAVAAVRAVSGVTLAAGSTTLNCATAAFTSADVGRSVEVSGANQSGVSLWTTIASVTNATTASLADPAVTSVSGATATLWNRNRYITISGGTWDRGNASGPTGRDLHSLLLLHIDGLVVRDAVFRSVTSGKYAVAVGDATDVSGQRLRFETKSDGFHVTGPAARVVVRDITGVDTGDDTVSFTARDYTEYDDVHGDIVDVLVDGITGSSATTLLKVVGGTGTVIRRFTARNIYGTADYLSSIIDDTTGASDIDGLVVENVAGNATAGSTLNLTPSFVRNATFRNIALPASGPSGILISIAAGVWDNLTLDGLTRPASNGNTGALFSANATTAIKNLSLSNLQASFGSGAPAAYLVSVGGAAVIDALHVRGVALQASNAVTNFPIITVGATVGALSISGVSATYAVGTIATGSGLVAITGAGTVSSLTGSDLRFDLSDTTTSNVLYVQGALTRYSLMNLHVTKGNCLLYCVAGSVVGRGRVANADLSAPNRLANLYSAADVTLTGLSIDTPLNPAIYVNGAPVTVRGSGINRVSAWSGFTRAGAEVVRVINPDWPADLSALAKNDGDAAYNTNAGLACGVGRAISNGTNWKNLYSGATY
jgi:hypothetical protein